MQYAIEVVLSDESRYTIYRTMKEIAYFHVRARMVDSMYELCMNACVMGMKKGQKRDQEYRFSVSNVCGNAGMGEKTLFLVFFLYFFATISQSYVN